MRNSYRIHRNGWYIRSSVLLVLLVFNFGCNDGGTPASAENDDPIFMRDSFRTDLSDHWQWVRENPDAYAITEEGLRIKLEPGGLMGAGKDAKNILVTNLPEKARLVRVHVRTQHESQFEQAGLILYHDDDNYIKLVKEHVDGDDWVVLVVEEQAQARVVNKVPAPDPETLLEFHFDGDSVTSLSLSHAGAEKVTVATVTFPMSPRPRIGVFTQSGEPGADRWAVFRDFLIASTTDAAEIE